MNINPIDIRHREFKKALRGYDTLEVETFINQIADRMEELLQENDDLKGEIREIRAKLESYTSVENAISETMVTAKQNASQMVRNAEQEAELIVKRAQSDGDKIIKEASERTVRMRSEIHQLELKKASLISEMKAILQTHLRLLENTGSANNSQSTAERTKSSLSESEVDRIADEFQEKLKPKGKID